MGCRLERAMSTPHRISIAANRLPLCRIQVTAFAASDPDPAPHAERRIRCFLCLAPTSERTGRGKSAGDSKLANSIPCVEPLCMM